MSQLSPVPAEPAASVLVPAGTTAGQAVREAGWPGKGADAVVIVQDAEGRLHDLAWAPEADTAVQPIAACTEAGRSVIRHRRLGTELDLFSFPDEIGSGLAVFHPKGGIIRRELEDYSRQRHEAAGYEFVYTPHITKAHLFETSGHLDWYAEGMFPACTWTPSSMQTARFASPVRTTT